LKELCVFGKRSWYLKATSGFDLFKLDRADSLVAKASITYFFFNICKTWTCYVVRVEPSFLALEQQTIKMKY